MIRVMSLVTYDLAKSTENGISARTQRLQTQKTVVNDLQVLKGSSFWITAESPDKVWIQVVRHNSPQDYSTVLFLTAVAQFRVLIRDSFLNIATATDERRDFRFSIHERLCRPFIK